MIKKLNFAVERLRVLKMAPVRLEYIANKAKFYNDREIEESNAQQAVKEKTKKNIKRMLLGICVTSLSFVFIILIAIIVDTVASNKKEKQQEELISKIVEHINQNNIDEAYSLFFQYDGWSGNDEYNAARDMLCEKLLAGNELDKAKKVEKNKQSRYDSESNELIGAYLIKQSMYEEAEEYYDSRYTYTEAVIKHMCKKRMFSEARRFVKRQSANSYEPQEFTRTMNTIINSYQ